MKPTSLRYVLLAIVTMMALPCYATTQRPIQPGPWSRSKIPDGWEVHKTRNYEIQSQAGEEKAERLGDHMEALNLVYRDLFRPYKRGSKRQVIKLFKDRKAYLRYGAPPSSAAYYSRGEREMVCYDTGKWSDEKADTVPVTGKDSEKGALARRLRAYEDMMKMDILGCAAHEGWHQYFSWLVVSFVELPSWINEGMGDYFYTAVPRERPTRRDPAELGNPNYGRLRILKAAIASDRFVPIPDLIHYGKAQYYANGSVCYAEGWALCQFLLHSGNERYREVIPEFIRLVKDDTNMDTVTEKAFKDIDLEKLNEEFLAYVATLKLPGEDKGKEQESDDAGSGKKGSGK